MSKETVKEALSRLLLAHYDAFSLTVANAPAPGWKAAAVVVDRTMPEAEARVLGIDDDGVPHSAVLGIDSDQALTPADAVERLEALLSDEPLFDGDVLETNLRPALDWFGVTAAPSGFARASVDAFRFTTGGAWPQFANPVFLEKLVAQEEARLVKLGRGIMQAAIDRDALDALRGLADVSSGTLRFYAGTGQKSDWRRQAAQVYPLLASAMSKPINRRIARAIDAGTPLAPVLESVLNIPTKILNRLRNMTWGSHGVREQDLLAFASEVPADWFPQKEDEWAAFCDAAVILPTLAVTSGRPVGELVQGCAGRWDEFLNRMLESVDVALPHDVDDQWQARQDEIIRLKGNRDERRAVLLNAVYDVRDIVAAFGDQVVLPMAVWHASYEGVETVFFNDGHEAVVADAASRILFDKKGAPAILEASRRWHHHAMAMETRIQARIYEATEWPMLTKPLQAPNGLWLVPLNTSAKIMEEGQRMNHCVGGYTKACRANGHHIISVREGNPDGHSICTMELAPDGQKFTSRQERAYGNGRPSAEATAACSWYRMMVNGRLVQVNMDDIIAFRQAVAIAGNTGDTAVTVVDPVDARCGYDWRDPREITRAYRQWADKQKSASGEDLQPYLAKVWRKGGVQSMLDSEAIRHVAVALNPYVRRQFDKTRHAAVAAPASENPAPTPC